MVGRKPFDVGRHVQHRVVPQVGDLGLPARQGQTAAAITFARRGFAQLHALALKDQVAVQFVQTRPGQALGGQQGGRRIVQLQIPNAPGHPKLAVLGRGKRPARQIAFELDLHIGINAFDQRRLQVLAQLGQCGRQVAVHTRRIYLLELALQRQHARAAALGRGLPLALPLALQIGVAQLQLPLRHAPLQPLALEHHAGLQGLHRHLCFFQNAGQKQRAPLAHAQLQAAAFVRHVQLGFGALQPGPEAGTAPCQSRPGVRRQA